MVFHLDLCVIYLLLLCEAHKNNQDLVKVNARRKRLHFSHKMKPSLF